MFDPMYDQPIEYTNDLDEEQYAQRYGSVVRPPSLRGSLSLRLGKFLIRIGERLTGECNTVELSRETA